MKVDIRTLGLELKSIATKAFSGNGESGTDIDGAAAVGAQVFDAILDQLSDDEGTILSLIEKCVVTNPGNVVKIASDVDSLEADPTTGVRAYWIEEGVELTSSKLQFRGVEMTLGKLVVRVPVTDELLEDSERLAAHVVKAASRAIRIKLEQAALFGLNAVKGVNGGGDDATVTVALTTPTEAQLVDAVALLHPDAKGVWYISKAVEAVLLETTFTNSSMFRQDDDGTLWLFGRQVVVHPAMTAAPNHIVLGDFSRFALAMRRPTSRMSGSVGFATGEQEFVVRLRVGGNVFAQRSSLDDGDEYGWFVVPEGGEALGSSSSSGSSDSSDSSPSTVTNSSQSSRSSLSSQSSQSTLSSQSSLSSLSSDSSASSDSSGSSPADD